MTNPIKNSNYGFWESAISAQAVAQNSDDHSQLKIYNGILYYCEQRPSEQGRNTILARNQSGLVSECLPKEYSAKSHVHEYGGGDFTVGSTGIYFVNEQDQAIYHLAKEKVTRITALDNNTRYADLRLSPDESYLVCVREQHENLVSNDLVCISLNDLEESILSKGADFYSSPVFSQDGKKLAWLQWNLPQMPWDGTELYSVDFAKGQVKNLQKIAGSSAESIYQPEFNNNKLYYVSDKTGWWNLYCEGENVLHFNAECGYPAWIFGTNTYTFLNANPVLLITEKGLQKIALIENNSLHHLQTGCDSIAPCLAADQNKIYFFGGNAQEYLDLREISIDKEPIELRHSDHISKALSIEFATSEGDRAYAFYYPPCNSDFSAPANTKPPLIVTSHGGPTSATSAVFSNKIQFWTSRGFAVIDVNYRGSTGYGRAYREKLYKHWGDYDVDDCIKAAEYCIEHNLCDSRYIFIRGKSASGLTALLCLSRSAIFAGAAIYYGVTDLVSLLNDTHKFESRYTDVLIGTYPAAKAIFAERSPSYHVDKIKAPVIIFQGLRDKVVLPAQSEMMVKALEKNHIPVEYVCFENEAHGFRDADNIIEALKRELEFYQRLMSVDGHPRESSRHPRESGDPS